MANRPHFASFMNAMLHAANTYERHGFGGGVVGLHLRVLRWLAQLLRCRKRAAVMHLLLNGVLAAIVLTALGLAAGQLLDDHAIEGDEDVVQALAEIRSTFVTDALLEVGALGGSAPAAMLVLAGATLLWVAGERYFAIVLSGAMAGGMLLNFLLKLPFDRPRPAVMVGAEMVHTTAFPSGHSLIALVGYGGMAFFASLVLEKRSLRRACWLLAAVLILSIGFARVYLGTHYPTDVIFAYLAGAAWLVTVVAAAAALKPLFMERAA